MPSPHESFWRHDTYVVVGHSARSNFPKLTFNALRAGGKTVHAVDPSCDSVEGENAHRDFDALLEHLAGDGQGDARASLEEVAAVIEVPRDETAGWIGRAADSGIKKVWIHMGRETPEALALAKERGVDVCHGTCAVQYLDESFPHSVHAWIRRLLGRY